MEWDNDPDKEQRLATRIDWGFVLLVAVLVGIALERAL